MKRAACLALCACACTQTRGDETIEIAVPDAAQQAAIPAGEAALEHPVMPPPSRAALTNGLFGVPSQDAGQPGMEPAATLHTAPRNAAEAAHAPTAGPASPIQPAHISDATESAPEAARAATGVEAAYTVQLGAFKSRERADSYCRSVSKQLTPVQVKAPSGQGGLYRVLHGSYSTKAAARAAADKARQSVPSCFVTTVEPLR